MKTFEMMEKSWKNQGGLLTKLLLSQNQTSYQINGKIQAFKQMFGCTECLIYIFKNINLNIISEKNQRKNKGVYVQNYSLLINIID